MNVWILYANGYRRRGLSIYREHLKRILSSYQEGAPLPRVDDKIVRRSYPVADFVSTGGGSIAISDHAIAMLRDLIEPHVELIPLLKMGKKYYSLLNVTARVDCIDEERSQLLRARDEDRILTVSTYGLKNLENVPPIFMPLTCPDEAFVTSEVVECVVDHKLTGAMFRDPAKGYFSYLFDGPYVNEIPGAIP